MAEKNKKVLIILAIILIMTLGTGKKEAAIPDYVEPGSSVSVMGELAVKSSATSFTLGQPAKIYWQICTTTDCSSGIKASGFEALTSSEISDLNDRLTSQFKTTTYYMNIISPTQEGTYYYLGTAETAQGLRVLEIDVDGFINFGNSNKFVVLPGSGCSDYIDEEIVDISNGIIRVTVNHDLDINTCSERGTNDIGFTVICNNGYTANQNGRQSTCNLTCTDMTWTPVTLTYCEETPFKQTSNCGTTRTATGTKTEGCTGPSTFEYRCTNSNNIYQVLNSNLNLMGTCNVGQVCGDAGVAKAREVKSTTELGLSWLAGANGGMCTTITGTGTWSPLTSSKACGESFTQTNSATGVSQSATGTACESGTCNEETAECEEEDDEFDFNKWIPFIIIFFAIIIGMKTLSKP